MCGRCRWRLQYDQVAFRIPVSEGYADEGPEVVSDNVVHLSTRLTEGPPLELRRKGWDACGHKHIVLDEAKRTADCSDCGEERIELFDVLANMALTWDRWTREAKALRELRQEQTNHEREVWERRRDRHFTAHPDHRADFDERFAHRLKTGGVSHPRDSCRECGRILSRYDTRWYPWKKEPKSGPIR